MTILEFLATSESTLLKELLQRIDDRTAPTRTNAFDNSGGWGNWANTWDNWDDWSKWNKADDSDIANMAARSRPRRVSP
ncbi:hypothetical protein [Actinomadura meyerae]|jgi:hypothetical protein|uniref:hypothetical protein n=1 Tax=Actinomadura meyerae TaxID=240840 RepID=UPI0011779AE1|nr:hypothetical protein [Actinomadura meyerae]